MMLTGVSLAKKEGGGGFFDKGQYVCKLKQPNSRIPCKITVDEYRAINIAIFKNPCIEIDDDDNDARLFKDKLPW